MIQIPIVTHWGPMIIEGNETHFERSMPLNKNHNSHKAASKPQKNEAGPLPPHLLKIKQYWESTSPDHLPDWDSLKQECPFDWDQLTEFQRKVLQETLKIPRGETRSYEEVAAAIGSPKASRAVGNAIAKNPFWPIIPCHRVIQKDGKIGAYSGVGGVQFKSWILAMERFEGFKQTL
jgi:methylated-DNA-[protein]-cysteine S-methyltransferase